MLLSISLVRVSAAILVTFSAGTATGQGFPSRPIRLVTAEAGGNNDFGARIIAQGISEPLGQPVIVDNRPNGVIPPDIVAKAPPTGHTLLVYNNGFWLGPLILKSPYDPVTDFLPVTAISVSPSIFVVYPALPANSIRELIALAKSRPGELNYASTGNGSSSYLAGELFKALAGANLVAIPYKGAAFAITDLIANRVQLFIPPATATTPHVKAGRLKALAITSAEPSTLYPGVPTVAASGVPGYEMVSRLGVFAPAKTPPAIINRLNQEIVRVMRMPEVRERFTNAGVETLSTTPQEFAILVKTEISVIAKVLKSADIQAE